MSRAVRLGFVHARIEQCSIGPGQATANRQLPGYRGTILCWANHEEMYRLRQPEWYDGDLPLPNELTTSQVINFRADLAPQTLPVFRYRKTFCD